MVILSGNEPVQVVSYHLFIYVLRLEIQLSRGEGWDQFDPTLFLCLDLLNVFSYSVI